MNQNEVKISKYLSYVLRHRPEAIGLSLDNQGWADLAELIDLSNRAGTRLTEALVRDVVARNDKQRFAINADGDKIRANQGHSLNVDLGLIPQAPPQTLYHGTTTRFVDSIRRSGLMPRHRHYVHLSPDTDTAATVGARRGEPVVLKIKAGSMVDSGHRFYLSENGIWLTEHVPVEFIEIPDRER